MRSPASVRKKGQCGRENGRNGASIGFALRVDAPGSCSKRPFTTARAATENIVFWPDFQVALLLVTMQHELLSKARATRDAHIAQALTWEDFMVKIADGKMCLTPYCNEKEFEELVKTKSKEEAIAAQGG
eukprot:scaffold180518_cov31-Tisochrysis_lutea.AAC.2